MVALKWSPMRELWIQLMYSVCKLIGNGYIDSAIQVLGVWK